MDKINWLLISVEEMWKIYNRWVLKYLENLQNASWLPKILLEFISVFFYLKRRTRFFLIPWDLFVFKIPKFYLHCFRFIFGTYFYFVLETFHFSFNKFQQITSNIWNHCQRSFERKVILIIKLNTQIITILIG